MIPTRRPRGFSRSLLTLGFSTLLILFMGRMALADPAVTITSPDAKSILSGSARVLGVATDANGLSYAILSVDAAGVSVTNAQPLRFELDTRAFPDGAHLLKVEIFDNGGKLASSPVVKVYFRNAAPPATIPGLVVGKPNGATNMAKPAIAGAHKPAATAGKPSVRPASQANVPNATAAGRAPLNTRSTDPVVTVTLGSKFSPAPTDADFVIVPVVAATPEVRPVRVLLDGKAVAFTPEPYITNGHTMVALRGLIAQAGIEKLRWDNSAKQATATVGGAIYLFTPDQRLVLRNGEALTLAEPLALADGRLFIPATAWRDLFDGSVAFNPATKEVLLRTTDNTLARLAN
ncbi:MAG: hypothetical protein BWY76_01543 [bacterium ADurb.Bin429]|nr:MAG: hypothetical protein BWY76_01543 [bacterium ADurb.Bin429]